MANAKNPPEDPSETESIGKGLSAEAAPKAEAAKADAAKVEAAAKADAAKVEAAAKADAAKVEAAARVDAAKVEAAKVEAAKVEAAKVEAAKVEAAKVEAVEAAKVEAATANSLNKLRAQLEQELTSITPSEVPLFCRPDYESLFKNVEQKVDTFLRAAVLAAVSPEEITKRLRDRRGNLPLGSDINTEIVGICKQVLAFGAAGLGLSLGFADKIGLLPKGLQKVVVVAGVGYVELVAVSLMVLFYYILQARFRYPFLFFTTIGNAWPFFYYASISADVPRFPLQLPRQVFRGGVLYARDLVGFGTRVVLESKVDELRVELQQYFLLLSYQGYVNQFSLRLTNLFFYGLSGAMSTVVVLTIWSLVK